MYILFEDFPTFKTFLYSKWSKNKKNKEHLECKQFLCLQENKSYSWVKLLQSEVMGMICYMYDDQEVYNSFEENEYLV